MTIKAEIEKLILEAIDKAQAAGELPAFQVPPISLERPAREEHGDFALSLPLQLARVLRMPPLRIAEIIARRIPPADFLARVEAAPPGFVNLTLSDAWLAQQVEEILAAGERYGDVPLGQGKRAQVEYVSINPTGPLHIGAGRNAAIGDALAKLLEAAGYEVQREYYVNDAGSRMEAFYRSLYARYAQALGREEPVPEDGYRGHYMVEMGQEIAREEGDKYLKLPPEESRAALGKVGLGKMLAQIRADLELMGIAYDLWFSEQSLYEQGVFDAVLHILEGKGYIARREGAVWFASTKLGDEKDNVIIRSDGTPDYLASDIAYHYHKFVLRGFDRVIDVWGADHQGHVFRLKAAVEALGIDPKRLTLLVYQLVTLKRGEEVVRLSKRTGDIITLREVLEEVGADATRYFLLAHSVDSQMDFDLELAKAQSEENPVYYVQYAHARIASILRYAEGIDFSAGDVLLLKHPAELALIRKLLLLPEMVERAVANLAPHHLPHYALDLAGAFHAFYRDCRVVSSQPEDIPLTKARLKLTLAAKIVLARALRLMGMSVPERM